METKQRFELREHSKQIEDLRAKRQTLGEDMYKHLESSELRFGKMELDAGELREDLSELEKGLQQYGQYKQTIADLAEGLTDGLTGYVEFAVQSQNYQGLERVLSFFNKKSADRKRLERINKQSPKENLKQILDFAEQLYSEIVATRTDAINTYNRLEANGDVIVGKLEVFEPQESALKEQLDTLEEAYKNKDAEYKKASAQRQAELVTQLNTDHRRLTQLRNEYDQILTVYSQAQQAIESNHQSRNAFEQMVRDLGRQATMLREKVDNVTEIYSAAPEAVKIMMTTKGMEEMDKAMNVGTDKSVDMITRAAYSVSSATLAREEVQLIDEQVMRGYSDRMREMADMFEQRFGGIRISAQKSREERYKKQ